MVFGDLAEHRKPCHLLVGKDGGEPFLGRRLDGLCAVPAVGHDHDILLCDQAVDHTLRAKVKDVVVGGDAAGDDGLAKPPGGLDDGQGLPGDRVGGEHDPGLLGPDEFLDDDGDVHAAIVESLFCAVVDGTRAIKRRPAPLDGVKERFLTDDVQEGLLLAGKTGVREVLGGGARPDGDDRLPPVHPGVGVSDLLADVVGHRGVQDDILHLSRYRFQRSGVIDVQTLQPAKDLVLDPGLHKKPAERLSGHHKSPGHRQTDGCHLTQ